MSATCAAGGTETEDQLRVRLSAAENTMRKLYRSNLRLKEDMERLALNTGGEGTDDASPAAARASHSAAAESTGAEALSKADEQAFFLLQQKESDLQAMRDYTSQLQERLDAIANLQDEKQEAAASATAPSRVDAANEDYRQRYLRARKEYHQLLRSRVGTIKNAAPNAQVREQQALMGQLEAALKEEADLHRKESQRLNEELYLQEKRECDWHVERRMLEDKVKEMEEEMKQRDDLDGAIESKMAALFGRLKKLEDDNLRLEQTNEQLNSRLGAKAEVHTDADALQTVSDDQTVKLDSTPRQIGTEEQHK